MRQGAVFLTVSGMTSRGFYGCKLGMLRGYVVPNISITGEVTGFTIIAKRPIDDKGIRELCKKIEALQPGLLAKPAMDFVKSVNQIQISQAVAWITSAIALIIGALGFGPGAAGATGAAGYRCCPRWCSPSSSRRSRSC
jgi:hypothetical protein